MKSDFDEGSSQNRSTLAAFAAGFAGVDCYRENAFRIAELGVDSSDRDFRRRIDAVEATGKIGMAAPAGPGRLFPLSPPADAMRLREVLQRLSNEPEQRLADEFFWFWPQQPGARGDEALLALGRGDAAAARKIWLEREKNPADRAVATHNLAVLAHHEAIELETGPEADAKAREAQRAALWTDVFQRWRQVHESEATWSWLHARIRALGDPRLTSGTVRRLEEWLPRAVLTANVQLAARFAAQNRQQDAARQIALLAKSGFDEAAEAVRNDAALPARSHIRTLCASAKAEIGVHPERGLSITERLLQQAQASLDLLELLLDAGNTTRKAARDEAAEQVRHGLIDYNNKTEDWASSVPLLERALKLAVSQQTRDRIEKDLKTVREHAQETNWWHGPGYYELPAPIVTELERGFSFSETGKHADALAVVISVCQGQGGQSVPAANRPVVHRVLAYALNRKSVRANNEALDIYNENPAIVTGFRKRLDEKFAEHERKRTDYAFFESFLAAKEGRAAQCQSLQCMICGSTIVSQFSVYEWNNVKVVACPGCRQKFLNELEAQKTELKRAMPGPMLEAMLAMEMNPGSKQLQENWRIIKERAAKFGVPVPATTLPLRLELGIATEEELFTAAMSWFADGRKAARHSLEKLYPARFAAFQKAFTFRVRMAWGIAAGIILAIVVLALSGSSSNEVGVVGQRPAALALVREAAPPASALPSGFASSAASAPTLS